VIKLLLADDEAMVRAGVRAILARAHWRRRYGRAGPPPIPAAPTRATSTRTNAAERSPACRLCFTDGRLSHKDTVTLDN
jgi:hypothetical protein